MIAEQLAEAFIKRFDREHPPAPPESRVPAPLKWAAGIISSLASLGVGGMCIWGVTTLSSLQQTVTRIDERQQLSGDRSDDRFGELDRRIGQLEAMHRRESGDQR